MLGDLWNQISGWMGDTMSSILESILNATIFRLFYYIERVLCWIIDLLYQMFEVFAGLVRVQYNGTPNYLINIFFSNKAVSNIYWAMALIGIALSFGFAIAAVVRKMFDSSGKVQQSLGQIIWGGIRSILVILGMTAIMNVVLNGTGVLMQQINYIFNDPYNLNLPVERSFTGEEYAAMGRVLCTIGNYSAVDSRDNRYNMNLCFNDIRPDMYFLQQQGIFEHSYYETDKDGNVKNSWQSVLEKIATSCDLSKDVKVDQYNDGVSRSLREAMDYLQTNANPRPVPTLVRKTFETNQAHLDRMIFLMGTFRAAKNPAFNDSPSFDDALRGRYYYGEGKSIYDLDNVDSDFNIGFPTDYIVVWIAAIAIIFDLVVIILNCIARIFNMLFLYLIAPPVIAAQPLDNGGKTKQWVTAFLVQSLSVFGTVISMRLLLLFLPIIVSPTLVLFESSPILNALAKLILIYGGFEAAKKSSSILTGILADSAGWQAVQAGDMTSSAGKAIGAAVGVGKAAAGVAAFAAKPITNTVSRPFKSFANAWSKAGTGGRQARIDKSIKEEVAKGKAMEQYKKDHPEDAKYLGGGGGGGGGGRRSGGSGGASVTPPPAPKPATPPSSSSPTSTQPGPTNMNSSQTNHSTSNTNQNNRSNPQPRNPAPAPDANPRPVVNPAPAENHAPEGPAQNLNGQAPQQPVNDANPNAGNPVQNQAQPANRPNVPRPAQRPPQIPNPPQNLNHN